MNQISRHSVAPIRPPIFFRITVGLFVTLILFVTTVALLLVYERTSISTAGGWGYLMGAFVLGVGAFFFACVAGVVSTALSLWRGEAHRRLSIALLIISSLVVWTLRRVPLVLVRLLLPHE